MPDFEIGIFFSGLTRSLVNSDYNLRVYECKTAAWNILAYADQPLKTFDKTFLRDIPKEILCLLGFPEELSIFIQNIVESDKVLPHGKQVICNSSVN